ncbi:uncharacterized protein L201_003430 [Kwoniella dendrophila CBS 6074]|uniref:Mid2 domain-containing protein n=1 Tax=Kwoniella dendrophila CBS 6074 TaxID=1295534 RepID=A0AAX4JUA9_9TREE
MIYLQLILPLLLSGIYATPLPSKYDTGAIESDYVSSRIFATRDEDGKSGGIGVGGIAGIIIALVVLCSIVAFIIVKRRRSASSHTTVPYLSPPPVYTSPPNKVYYPSQRNYPILPRYSEPNRSSTHTQHSGIKFPSAIYPSANGHYKSTTHNGVAKGVRFGEVGVRNY